MLASPVSRQVRVVGGGGVGDRLGTSGVQVTEIVGQLLQIISGQVVVVPENLVVTRPAGALDSLVTEQVEISLSGMVDPLVHHGPGQSVPILVFVVVSREEPSTEHGDQLRLLGLTWCDASSGPR